VTLVSVVDALQHAVKHDTVLVHDRIRVVDTLRVLVHEGGASLLALVATIAAVASAVGAGVWKLAGVWLLRHQAHLRINAEAISLRRELQASIGDGPAKNLASVWAQACQRGFDIEEERFDRLTELALSASKRLRGLIGDERRRFLDAAKVLNESAVGMWDANKAQAMNDVYSELQQCVGGLSKIIDITKE